MQTNLKGFSIGLGVHPKKTKDICILEDLSAYTESRCQIKRSNKLLRLKNEMKNYNIPLPLLFPVPKKIFKHIKLKTLTSSVISSV